MPSCLLTPESAAHSEDGAVVTDGAQAKGKIEGGTTAVCLCVGGGLADEEGGGIRADGSLQRHARLHVRLLRAFPVSLSGGLRR
mmetsp:Transcript_7701/g.18440  ORF Transcript_7701/g.18440 Transcript_7701/m.18440 type:complete len:84 (+) Transcript_7701:99-350(+)